MESEQSQFEEPENFHPFEIFFLALFWKMQSYGLTANLVRCLPTLGNTCSKCKICSCKSPWDNFLKSLMGVDSGIEYHLSDLEFKEAGRESEIVNDWWLSFEKDHPGIFQQVKVKGRKFITMTPWALSNEVPRICYDLTLLKDVQAVCVKYASRGPDNFFATYCKIMESRELEAFLRESSV